jgi:hypothetical protein
MDDTQAQVARVTQGSFLQMQDQMHSAKKYLTENAINDLNRKSESLIAEIIDGDNRKYATTVFFSVQTKTESIEKGVERLSTIMNELSAEGLIHSTLSSIRSIELARMPMKAQTFVVFAYVLIPMEKNEEIKNRYPKEFTIEGGVGQPLGDLNLDLLDGEFVAEINVSPVIAMMNIEGQTTAELLQKQIEQFLVLLPKGTVVKEVTPCAIVSVAYPFEVKFYNPLMQSVKSISVEHVRNVAMIDGRVEQFNLLTGVKYFDANQQQLFV